VDSHGFWRDVDGLSLFQFDLKREQELKNMNVMPFVGVNRWTKPTGVDTGGRSFEG